VPLKVCRPVNVFATFVTGRFAPAREEAPVPPFAIGNVPVTFVVKLVNVVEVVPVPPFAIGRVPVTPVVKGKPVAFVRVPLVGVPRIGVTKVGEVANTNAPVPVSSVTAAERFALDGVARKVAMPVPRPDTPVLIGKPVALVKVTLEGVPSAGVTRVGLVANTRLPVPVSSVTALSN
jgi:hypothetical protein